MVVVAVVASPLNGGEGVNCSPGTRLERPSGLRTQGENDAGRRLRHECSKASKVLPCFKKIALWDAHAHAHARFLAGRGGIIFSEFTGF
ncbi:hypothetical protein ASPBRDRAFT_36448 [Aspergillus brasiliensis CBS 101740]|uniref:Uncharacterized protein n=1 Tax=Aspergillus brasiliensis (strain CBS 101740 / IMI 381727 / IBT 21946) TaxID=767769 RepID=A0A1L9UZY1_ASPBC|nr:hypothetical protein ASPBRDRAFT_36448 [Aspergillus brasiliensis CBS 101740]